VPLPWFRREQTLTVTVGATIGGARSNIISDVAEEEAAWWQAQSDVSVTWLAADTWSVALRYQYARQLLSPDEIGNLAVVPASFTRNTAFLEVTGSWPSRPAASIPQRTNARVDRSDEQAIGDEGQQVGGGNGQRR